MLYLVSFYRIVSYRESIIRFKVPRGLGHRRIRTQRLDIGESLLVSSTQKLHSLSTTNDSTVDRWGSCQVPSPGAFLSVGARYSIRIANEADLTVNHWKFARTGQDRSERRYTVAMLVARDRRFRSTSLLAANWFSAAEDSQQQG